MVIKTADFKESDKLVWLFTEKLGKVSAIAKGAKKSKSKILSLTLPFCFGDFVLYKGQNLYTINEGEIINSFQTLLTDFDSLTYASYLCELIDISLVEEESNRILFKELMTAFYLMASKAVDYCLLARAFEVKLISLTGYNFNFENCCMCKRKISTSNYLMLDELSGVCSDCEKTKGVNISFAAYNSLKYLSRTSLENISKLTLDSKVKEELNKILSAIIAENYGRTPNSLKAFKFFKGEDFNE